MLELLEKAREFGSIESVVNYYSQNLYQIRVDTERGYELTFAGQKASPILVPHVSEKQVSMSPYFYLDDMDVILDLREMMILVLMTRLEYFQKKDYKLYLTKLLKKDISCVMKGIVHVKPFSSNNLLKIQHRIRIVKLYWTDKKGEKQYHETLGDALWPHNTPNSAGDMHTYARLFNDPIAVQSLGEAVYCHLGDATYNGVGYASDRNTITSIYEQKSNLPERLRQHYSSAYLQPLAPDTDYLIIENNNAEKINALTVFIPVTTKDETPFNDQYGPVGQDTLLAGELLISEEMASKKFYVRRTFTVQDKECEIVDKGSILQPGDILAWNPEGFPELIYDLNYADALVEDVIQLYNGIKIVIKVVSELGVGRLISEYGIKGVTHPRKQLGEITLSNGITIPVDMVSGPVSMKSGSNGIKLAHLNLKQSLTGEILDLKPGRYSETEVETLTADMQKVKWTYNGKEWDVYAGLVPVGITDLAKDCRSTGVYLSPETLKYMYLLSEPTSAVADILLSEYTSTNSKWKLLALLKLKDATGADKSLPCYEWDDTKFQTMLKNTYFVPSNFVTRHNTFNMLLAPANQGFYIKFFDKYFRIAGADLINAMTYHSAGMINYPGFYTHATFLLMSLKSYCNQKSSFDQVLQAYDKYISYIDTEIYAKKAALPSAIAAKVPGGHLKQLVSTYVPKGVTVVCDELLEARIRKFKGTYDKPIYEIGVRNPVLWSFQFQPRKVWTFARFKRYLETRHSLDIDEVLTQSMLKGSVLRNISDTLYDKADTDGDLYPVAIPFNADIQDHLNTYNSDRVKLRDYEKSWIRNYINSELQKNNKFINLEPFKLHTVSREWFSKTMATAAAAKAMVGVATVDLWKFHTTAEFKYIAGDITSTELHRLMFTFSRICQDYVVEGIKHNAGGATGYDVFELKNIKDNETLARQVLADNFDLEEELINKFITIAYDASSDHTKLVSRLATGSRHGYLAKKINLLKELDLEQITGISYCKLYNSYLDVLC